MSYRPEDRDKNNCPSRGLGLAAAVLGVGVGAALYYFCNRRSQNPHSEGSTSQWTCEQPNALTEDEQIKRLREQAFRERSWSLEECSICYEVMLLDQQVMRLPCAHNFHTACIATWLQEQRTCPYCRKPAE